MFFYFCRIIFELLAPDQQGGSDFFFGAKANTFFGRFECHEVDKDANSGFGVARPGFFGTGGHYNVTRLSTQALIWIKVRRCNYPVVYKITGI